MARHSFFFFFFNCEDRILLTKGFTKTPSESIQDQNITGQPLWPMGLRKPYNSKKEKHYKQKAGHVASLIAYHGSARSLFQR